MRIAWTIQFRHNRRERNRDNNGVDREDDIGFVIYKPAQIVMIVKPVKSEKPKIENIEGSGNTPNKYPKAIIGRT